MVRGWIRLINGCSIMHVLHFDSTAFFANLLSTIDNVYICNGGCHSCFMSQTHTHTRACTHTHTCFTFHINQTLVTSAPLFAVRASVLRHQAWPAATPNDQGVAAGSPQAAHLSPWGFAELWIAAKTQTGLRQRAHQGGHDDWSLDLHWRGQHRSFSVLQCILISAIF